MPPRLRAALAAGVHALVVLVVAVAATRGLHIPDSIAGYLDTAAVAAGVSAWSLGLHWLATRKGNSWTARTARYAAKILTLGAGTLVPAKPVPAP